MSFARLLDPIGSFPQEQILGIGRTGFVVRQEQLAVKLPLGWSRDDSDEMVKANIKSLQHEQAIYERLGKCDGIVSFIDFSETSTRLRVMENGDLRSYLTRHNKPSKSLQLSWFRVMACTLAYIHDRRVLVADIATRNFLLDSDLSIKICDFTESTIMPLSTCMESANYGGYSIQTDIGQLGAVMYEVVVGRKCAFDIFKEPELSHGIWPRRGDLPSTKDVWLGPIIEKCWTEGAFLNAHELWEELESIEAESEQPVKGLSSFRGMLALMRRYSPFRWCSSLRPTIVLGMVFSAITAYTWSRKHNLAVISKFTPGK